MLDLHELGPGMATSKPEEGNISVGIRVRPPNAKEQRYDEQIAWNCISDTKICGKWARSSLPLDNQLHA